MRSFVKTVLVFLLATQACLAQTQDSVLARHRRKVPMHGHFTFCVISIDTVTEITFSYSLNIKKKSFTISPQEKKIICWSKMEKSDKKSFSSSEVFNNNPLSTCKRNFLILTDPR
jgi:hypothetical protein